MSLLKDDSVMPVAAAISTIICAQMFSILIPFFLGSLVESAGFEMAMASDVIAAGTCGVMLGTLLVLMKGHIWNRQIMSFGGFSSMVLGNLVSLYFQDYAILLVSVFFIGLGSGVGIGVGAAVISGGGNTAKRFGIVMMSVTTFSTLSITIVPHLIEAYGVNGVFILLLTYNLFGFIFIKGLPRYCSLKAIRENGVDAGSSNFARHNSVEKIPAAIAIFAAFLIFFGISAYLPFIERIAVEANIESSVIAYSVSVGAFFGGFLSMLAGFLGKRIGHIRPLVVAGAILIVGAWSINYKLSAVNVMLVVPLFFFGYILMGVFNNASLADMDVTGRVLVFGIFVETAGWFIGPLFAGQVLRLGGDYHTLLAVLIFTTLIYLLLKTIIPAQKYISAYFSGRLVNSNR